MLDITPQPGRSLATEVSVVAFLHYREYLQAVYFALKKGMERYSYLAFAEDLGFSRTNVIHLVISGKRPLTVKGAQRAAEALGLKGLERRYLETLVRYNNSRQSTEREELFQELLAMKNRTLKSALDKAQLEFFSEWYHPVIREMMLMPSFKADPEWIAATVFPRIRPEQARKSLELLEHLGLARLDNATHRYVAVSSQVSTGDEVMSMAVARYHQRTIDLGKETITLVNEHERDISAITVCVSAEMAERMKREVQEFRKRLLAMAEEARAVDRVYQLNLQLFPVTRRK